MAHDVFISYSHKDRTVADAICNKLETDGIRCWYAPRDVEPGADWAGSIVSAIRESRVFVLVFSKDSNTSKHVLKEVDNAVNFGLIIIPFRIDDSVMVDSMTYYLSSTHWLDALTPPLEKYINQLSGRITHFLSSDKPDASDQGKISQNNHEAVSPVGDRRTAQIPDFYEAIKKRFTDLFGSESDEFVALTAAKNQTAETAESSEEEDFEDENLQVPACRIKPHEEHFTIVPIEGFTTMAFAIEPFCIREEQIQILRQLVPEINEENGSWTFSYMMKARRTDFLLLTFSNDPPYKKAFMNSAIFENDAFYLSERPTRVGLNYLPRLNKDGTADYAYGDTQSSVEQLMKLGLLEAPVDNRGTKHDSTETVVCCFDPSFIQFAIVDPVKKELIRPALKYNNDGELIAALDIDLSREYFIFHCVSYDENGKHLYKPSNLEIGLYYTWGQAGFDKNIRKAASEFYADLDNPECAYELGCIFIYDKGFRNLTEAEKYLTLAVSKNHNAAKYELAKLMIQLKRDSESLQCAVKLLSELRENGYKKCGDESIDELYETVAHLKM